MKSKTDSNKSKKSNKGAKVDKTADLDKNSGVFQLSTEYTPAGDQPQAISKLLTGLDKGLRYQTLFGVTGSGKTYTMANVIASWRRKIL
jgi:primosomal protein N'